jgi:hypothetical protein
MGKTGHQQTISWDATYEQQIDYYMNIPTNQTVPSAIPTDIYPWMNEKKHGNNKNKNSSGKMGTCFF